MNERVNFDKFAENYDQLLLEQTGFFSKSDEYFARYKVELARELVARPVKKILEYGCGTGRNIPFLRSAFTNAKVIGSDISEASLALAKKMQPDGEFFVEPGEGKEYLQFDFIFVAGVFHHIPVAERAAVVALLKSRLTDGGELIVFEHNPYNPVTRRIVSNCPYDADAVLLRPSQLGSLLASAGFERQRQGYCLFVPPRFSKLLWVEQHVRWLPLGGQYFIHARK
jgi:SAM-dependent methyltransferase